EHVDWRGELYFVDGRTGSAGGALWRSNGTVDGTRIVAEVPSGRASLITYRDRLLLRFENNRELWISDGTATGTKLVRGDVTPAQTRCGATRGAVVNGVAYWMSEPPNGGAELWRTDGSAAGTYVVRSFDSMNAQCLPLQNLVAGNDGHLYFLGSESSDVELWTSDGTAEGTRELVDLQPASPGSMPSDLTFAGTHLYFRADGLQAGDELHAIANLNLLPQADSLPASSVTPGSPISFVVRGSDPDGDELRYELARIPSGAAFDTYSGTFRWTPASTQIGTHALTFRVLDGKGGTALVATTVVVTRSISATPQRRQRSSR
ncbi:MAG TPA: putative Ig domain-containing protein, partial [Thermoanaerobaculia bacterium]